MLIPWFLLLHSVAGESQSLWREDDQRVRLGLKIFPACLGALESLASNSSSGGALLVLVVYEGSDATAGQAASSFNAMTEIRGHPVTAQVLSSAALETYTGNRPAGIFVASVGLDPSRLRAWSERHRTLVFSPFAGAVEDGAVAGIYVADRILPFVNLAQARRAGIRFKSFFLDVARRYEGD